MASNKTNELNKILSCVGTKVSFKFPANEGDQHGILKDRTVVERIKDVSKVPYWVVVDLIEFKGGKKSNRLRFGYYRKPNGKLNWGSQTALTTSLSNWRRIFVKAAREKAWFRKLLQDVMNELEQ